MNRIKQAGEIMVKFFLSSTFVLFCSTLIESSLLSNITFLPAIPDLSLLCILFFSTYNGKLYGETTGFISGVFLDFLTMAPFGFNCLLRTVIGYLTGFFNKTLPMLLGFLATLFKALLIFLVSVFYPNSIIAYNPFTLTFLVELIFNTVLAPFVFMFLRLFKKTLVLYPEQVKNA